MIKTKKGVVLKGLGKEMQIANALADKLWGLMGRPLTITSGLDGVHMPDSKHYTGEACDYRSRYFSNIEKAAVVKMLRVILGNDYDVVMETTHIHVEYDPDVSF